VRALQPDVERPPVLGLADRMRDERPAACLRHERERRIGDQARIARKVQTRVQVVQQSTRKKTNVDVRGTEIGWVVRPEGVELARAVRMRAEASERAFAAGHVARLPDLHDRIGDGLTFAIKDTYEEPDAGR